MHPFLRLGPLALPTGIVLTLLAVALGIDVAARVGRRRGLNADDVGNTALLALVAGLIVARLWNAAQFWFVYADEPLLLFSLRPSGFALAPGLVAAAVAGYAWLWRRRLNPLRVLAALAVGALAGAAVLNVSAHLTGEVVGTLTDLSLGQNYFGELRHPVGLYRAAGLALAAILLWALSSRLSTGRLLWGVVLAYALVRLAADGFVDVALSEAALVGSLRMSQVVALGVAVVACVGLASQRDVKESTLNGARSS